MKFFRTIQPVIIIFPIICLSDAIELTSVEITGNRKSKDKIIMREIHHNIPGEFDSTMARDDRNRIYNLGLFSTVKIFPEDSTYVISVVESPGIIPFPIIDYEEAKGKDGWTVGGGIAMLNFRGLNERVSLGYAIGAYKFYFLRFQDPWITEDHVSITGDIGNFVNSNAVYNFNKKLKYLKGEVGFYLNLQNRIKVTVGFEELDLTVNENSGNTEPTPLNEFDSYRYIFTGINYTNDTRDIYNDPTQGLLWYNQIFYSKGFEEISSFLDYSFTFNTYKLLNDWKIEPVICLSFQGEIKTGKDLPIFERNYLGGEGLVRGYSPVPKENPIPASNKIEVEDYLFVSVQNQFTLIQKSDYGGIEFGMDGVIFTDYGTGSLNTQQISLENGIVGFGLGIRLFLSGIDYIGVDMGFNPYSTVPRIHLSSFKRI